MEVDQHIRWEKSLRNSMGRVDGLKEIRIEWKIRQLISQVQIRMVIA